MFIKFILIVFLLAVVFIVGAGAMLRAFLSMLPGLRPKTNRSSGGHFSSRNDRFGNGKEAEHMLPCAVCGVHVPESEGIKAAGKFFCCEAHCK